MNLSEIIKITNFKMNEENIPFLWNCFGKNARILDFNSNNLSYSVSCVFDSETQKIYEVNICSSDSKYYRWIDENFIEIVKKEYCDKNIDFKKATDELNWIDLDNTEDVLRKVTQVIENGVCDEYVVINLDLEKDVIFNLSMLAHEKNITLNEMIVEILRKEMNKKNDYKDKCDKELYFKEKIKSCWNILTEMKYLEQAVLENDIQKNQIVNILVGLKEIYQIKFDDLHLIMKKTIIDSDVDQLILACWEIIDDITLIYESIDKNQELNRDNICNQLMGISCLYELKFIKLSDAVEKLEF